MSQLSHEEEQALVTYGWGEPSSPAPGAWSTPPHQADGDDFWYRDTDSYAATHAGHYVSPDSAMRSSTVGACVRIVAGALAITATPLYERTGERSKRRATDHPLYRIAHDRPNSFQTAFDYKFQQASQLLLRGNYYAEKIRSTRGRLEELIPIHPDDVSVDWVKGREKRKRTYDVSPAHDGKARVLRQEQIHHVHGISLDEGLTGASQISLSREGISSSFAAEALGARFFRQGTVLSGMISSDLAMSEPEREANKKAWRETMTGYRRAHQVAFLGNGLKWQTMTMPFKDAQFLELRQYQVIDIARCFGVPLWLLQAQEKETAWGTGMSQMLVAFRIFTLLLHQVNIEQAFSRDCIPDDEQGRFFMEFLTDTLLRGDPRERFETHQIAIQNGVESPDEVRAFENMNPREDGLGGRYWRPSNMVPDTAVVAPTGQPKTMLYDHRGRHAA